MGYYYQKAPRLMSNGSLPQGEAFGRGYQFEYGITGPHSEKDIRKLAAWSGGKTMSQAEGELYLEAIRQGADPMSLFREDITPEGYFVQQTERSSEPTYQEALRQMAAASFDWESVTGGSRKKKDVMGAYRLFASTIENEAEPAKM